MNLLFTNIQGIFLLLDPKTIFNLVNGIALFAWVGLVLLPNPKLIQLYRVYLIGLFFGIAYSIFIAVGMSSAEGSFSSLDGVRSLFMNDYALLAGWIHYLAFDLFLGVWETNDAKESGIPKYLLIPCLIFTFYIGPFGYLLYIIIKKLKSRS
ncbi:MAG: ABA4-like family protein [Leptospira sp.]|nr:ABA4-like family protein [Leptospira sp.]